MKEIYIADYDGHSSTVMPITNFGSITLSPTWSPDARNLAYVSFRKGWADIYLHGIYAPGAVRFQEFAKYKGNNITPAWNPADANELAVSLSWSGSPEIYLMSCNPKKSYSPLDGYPWDRLLPRVLAGWEDAGLDLGPSRPEAADLCHEPRRASNSGGSAVWMA